MIDYVTFRLTTTPARPGRPIPAVHPLMTLIVFAKLRCRPVTWRDGHIIVRYTRRHPAVCLEKTPAFRRLYGSGW